MTTSLEARALRKLREQAEMRELDESLGLGFGSASFG